MGSYRTFTSPGGNLVNGVAYVYDQSLVVGDVTGNFRPAFSTDFAASLSGTLNIDSATTNALLSGISGQMTTNLGSAAWVTGQVSSPTSSLVSNNGVSGVAQVVLPDTPGRKAWYLKNLHTGALMVSLGSNIPTAGTLNLVLAGGTAVGDGKGGEWRDQPAGWTGPVSVSGNGGSPMSYIAWQLL